MPDGFGTFTEYPIPDCSDCQPGGMALGQDGLVWFANLEGGAVDSIDTSGNVQVHKVDAKERGLLNFDVASSPDRMWFTAFNAAGQGWIGHMARGGATLFPIPFSPLFITHGFTEMWFGGGNNIAKISSVGTVTAFTLDPNSNVEQLVRGPDGNIWFTDEYLGSPAQSRIGKITPVRGKITEFAVPGDNPAIDGITVGPDGNLWFTYGNQIGSCTTAGVITTYPVPTPSELTYGIVSGPADDLYFTELDQKIGRVTLNPVTLTEYQVPFAGANPTALALGADANIWFSIPDSGYIGRFTTH